MKRTVEPDDAIRSALRALEEAERALKLASPQIEDSSSTGGLYHYLKSVAEETRERMNHDPESFAPIFQAKLDDVKSAVLRGYMYQITSRGFGTVSFDNTEGTSLFERAVKCMRQCGIPQNETISKFVETAHIKKWGDVNTDTDLVIVRYEAPKSVNQSLDEEKLSRLVSIARKTAGEVDRARTELEKDGIVWRVTDPVSNQIDTQITVEGIAGYWAVCIHTEELLDFLVDELAIIATNYDCPAHGWWDAARSAVRVPSRLLPIVRGLKPYVVCKKEDAANIIQWAKTLSGWNAKGSRPLLTRNICVTDIL